MAISDQTLGAMPPAGHAVSKREQQVLRDWIKSGAFVPTGTVITFTPQGELPRSR